MRGVVLLAVGVLLIWLGATTSRNTSEAAAAEGGGQAGVAQRGAEEERAEDSAPVSLELVAQVEPEREPQPELDPDPSTGPAASPGSGEEAARAPLQPAESAAVADTEELGAEPEVLDPPAELPQVRPRSSDEVDQDPPAFRLGGPGDDPLELAVLLLESWGDADPTALEAYLNDAKRDLSKARRRLVASFWQAVAGDPDVAVEAADALSGAEGVTTAQVALLRAAGDPGPLRAVPATAGRRDPLARAMRMVLLQDRAVEADRAGDVALAARSWSDLIHLELDAEWPPHRAELLEWAQALGAVQARYRLDPGGVWPSLEVEVLPNDNLSEIRARVVRDNPRLRVSVDMLRRFNRLGKFIHPGDVLRVPTETPNVLVDLDARLVVYRHGTEAVLAWECGIGKEGHDTPPGTYEIGLRQTDPAYMPDGRQARPFGHPENPLGTRWLAWHLDGENTSYGIHGTWEPEGVGQRVSQGCVRMRNEDVEVLYDLLPLGAQVVVQP